MAILHLAYLNNDPEIKPKCAPVGGEPDIEADIETQGIVRSNI